MFKFTVLYRRVDDEASLEQFFSETHLPLAEQLTHLVKSEVCRIHGKPGGESRFHLMYELYFDSAESYHASMLTQTGIALMQALKPWGDNKLLSWFYSESFEEARIDRTELEEDEDA